MSPALTRLDALGAVYDRLADLTVVTIMGAVAAELQSLGHRENFFYLQHAMGLASSMGLGIALAQPHRGRGRAGRRRVAPDEPRRPHDAGPLSAGQPAARRIRQREPAVRGRFPHGDVHRHGPGGAGGRGRHPAHLHRAHARRVRRRVRRGPRQLLC
ncbi:MAG: hypothetical protein R2712_30615 [Vicinamibacterales bacterium]